MPGRPAPAAHPTAPLATATARTMALPVSTTSSVDSEGGSEKESPVGPEKKAPSPTPFALPATPPALPAKVLTDPPGETARSTLLPVSAT